MALMSATEPYELHPYMLHPKLATEEEMRQREKLPREVRWESKLSSETILTTANCEIIDKD